MPRKREGANVYFNSGDYNRRFQRHSDGHAKRAFGDAETKNSSPLQTPAAAVENRRVELQGESLHISVRDGEKRDNVFQQGFDRVADQRLDSKGSSATSTKMSEVGDQKNLKFNQPTGKKYITKIMSV